MRKQTNTIESLLALARNQEGFRQPLKFRRKPEALKIGPLREQTLAATAAQRLESSAATQSKA
ncbi:hypothetical protein [Bradyrhizobium vignae]|uniref:hypothetical protein n=1 Tax=Bradyrhizobium vignae TaxID=1549949 RepID=UPI00100BB4E1|nr:hypothetical protein [Bradyrhizobium vignae]RXG97176.1 hypothetical protein EAV90_22655 [Bradyrhizobium vignae]